MTKQLMTVPRPSDYFRDTCNNHTSFSDTTLDRCQKVLDDYYSGTHTTNNLEKLLKKAILDDENCAFAFLDMLNIKPSDASSVADVTKKPSEFPNGFPVLGGYDFTSNGPITGKRLDKCVEFLVHGTDLKDYADMGLNIRKATKLMKAGMGTNGRKNKSGSTMENIVENQLNIAARELGNVEVLVQPTVRLMRQKGIVNLKGLPDNLRFDFAMVSDATDEVALIETNVFNSSGSKQRAIANDFIERDGIIRKSAKKDGENARMVYITDGVGWKKDAKSFDRLTTAFGDRMFTLADITEPVTHAPRMDAYGSILPKHYHIVTGGTTL